MAKKANESDQQLLEGCRQNEMKSFDLLFHRYARRLHNYGIKYLSNAEVAEEKMMDVMAWVWENRQAIPRDVDFEPYVFRAMKNAAAMEVRKRVLQTVPLTLINIEENTDQVTAASPLLCSEINASYQDKLNALSPQRRKAYVLSREEGLCHADIAEKLDISLHTVKNHIKAALSHFRSHMQEFTNSANLIFILILLLF